MKTSKYTQGPWLVRIECASCGYWLVSIRKGSVLARIVSEA